MAELIITEKQNIVALANSIRNRTEETSLLTIGEMIDDIGSITGGVELPQLTNEGSAGDLLSGKELIDGDGNVVTGSFTLESEITTQDNLIAQIQSAVDSLPDAEDTEVILQNKTVTPTASSQFVTVDDGYDVLNSVLVNGDENLVAENIISGVSIFGVEGTASGGGSGEETITFSVVNNLPDLISIYGKICLPNETTIVSVPIDASYLGGMPVTIWVDIFSEEYRDYYNDYSVIVSYPILDEDGDYYDETFNILTSPQNYPFCILGVTEVVPNGSDVNNLTIYCEEV